MWVTLEDTLGAAVTLLEFIAEGEKGVVGVTSVQRRSSDEAMLLFPLGCPIDTDP